MLQETNISFCGARIWVDAISAREAQRAAKKLLTFLSQQYEFGREIEKVAEVNEPRTPLHGSEGTT